MNQAEALKILKTGANVFLTGEPGSGKTHTINQYVAYLHSHGIEPAITASTGIAATHIGGMTIHSWSGIGIKSGLSRGDLQGLAGNDYVKKRIGAAKTLIIDEISMLPPDALRMVDLVCQAVKNNPQPFGGMQVVAVGDFFQLPPVVKNRTDDFIQEELFEEAPARFVYETPVWERAEFLTCYLSEQYRQDDTDLLNILSKIRRNSFDAEALSLLAQRKAEVLAAPAEAPKLYSHNLDVDLVNTRMLAQIPGESRFFQMRTKGHEALINVMKKGCLSPESLYLKLGASVMFTKNNQKEGFVNGTLGIVEDFSGDLGLPVVRTRSGRRIVVSPADWTVEEDGKIKGTINQLPLRLAWAITVHKSQGISLDEAVIDLSKVFEFGQGYVALSRVRRLSGIYLLGWNEVAFQVDPEILKKDREFQIESGEAEKFFARITLAELEKMLVDFIVSCDGEVKESDVRPRKSRKKTSTIDETLILWKEGKSIKEIASLRELSEKTIFSHLEDLVKAERINQSDLRRAASPKLLEALPQIQIAFKKLKTEKLTPVYEHFRGKYSYDELKLARLLMTK